MQQCMQCKKAYEITKDDQKMYQQFQIPESMICHQCYLQTFFAFRNMRFFYKRHCDKCKREIISIYSADKPYPVYCNECFWKDDWSPFDYGREIDFSKPFFEQWNELALQVPHPHMISGDNENADYTCNSRGVKNCYMSSVVYNGSEDIYYSFWTFNCKNCCDIHYSYHSQLCYECYHIDDCYNCNFCIQSKNLTDCDYCSYCNNCTNCLFSVNLRNKKHHIFNKEYSPEEYEKKRAEIFANYETIQQGIQTLHEFELTTPHLFAKVEKSEQCIGNEIRNSKNCFNNFDVINCENCRYVYAAGGGGATHECIESYGGDGDYSSHFTSGIHLYNCHYCKYVWDSRDSLYLDYCRNTVDCFGCVSLKQGKYSILNKEYSEVEYQNLQKRLIEHMKQTGEWGKFFPIKYSPFGYNETDAMDFFPLTKKQIQTNGWQWRDEESGVRGKTTMQWSFVPQRIQDVDDTILCEVLECETCSKNFKFIQKELEFYRMKGLPVPHQCHNCRHLRRNNYVLPYQLFDRICAQCQKDLKSPYAPTRPEIIYCETCYQEALY